jgi:hypothetical protein
MVSQNFGYTHHLSSQIIDNFSSLIIASGKGRK